MKLLLDECIDRRLAIEFQGHDVRTVPKMGWAGVKNSDLLRLAEREFDIFITVDRIVSFQQNLLKFKIAVLVLHAPTNRLVDLKPLVPDLLAALSNVKIGQVVSIGP